MQATECTPRLQLVSVSPVMGFLQGLRQPALRLVLMVQGTATQPDPATDGHWAAAATWSDLQPVAGGKVLRDDGLPDGTAGPAWLWWLADGLLRLQRSAGWLLHEAVAVERWQPLPGAGGAVRLALLVPGPLPQVLGMLVPAVLQHLNQRLQAPAEPHAADVQAWLQALLPWAPGGHNNRYLLQAAAARGVPVLALPGGVYQLGWGRRSRLFKSTLSDASPAVATAWARDKAATNALLRMAGLPVPAQRPVRSLDEALAAAQQLGYPVVLKPADLDQGLGVEADLRDAQQLRLAHARALGHGRPLLLEKHMPGEDYRVYVVKGELMGVAHRQPAQVRGDGVSRVAQLVEAENVRRQPQPGQTTVYKPIALDEEALELMARQGFGPDVVLPAGRVLRLRRSANSSRGGTSVDVTQRIHPDNVALCVRAAALLRLDIAGLDLLIPDIARSWREGGAAFCEVNAQPQMGGAHPWIFDRILQRYVAVQGRVPAVLVLGPPGPPVLGRAVALALGRAGWPAALVWGRAQDLIGRARAAVMQPDTAAVVVQTDGLDLLTHGVPLDGFDVLVVGGSALAEPALSHTLQGLTRHVTGVVLWDGSQAADAGWPVLARWAAEQAPLTGRDGHVVPRLQRLAGVSALPPAVSACVQRLFED